MKQGMIVWKKDLPIHPLQGGWRMLSTDAQVRKVFQEMNKSGKVGVAAMKADLDRKTASKYINTGKLP